MPESPAVKPSNTGALITRIVIWSSVAVLLVLAGMDYLAKQKSQQTFAAWEAVKDKKDVDGESFVFDDLAAGVVGNPAITDLESNEPTRELKLYTWPGILRKYQIQVAIRKVPKTIKQKAESREILEFFTVQN